MRLTPWLSACTLALSACLVMQAQEADLDRTATQLASRISDANGGPATVAVVDFSDLQGRVTELGRYYAEELSVALVNTGKGLKVIDRAHLLTLLKELKFQNSGLIDERTASELGRLAGVNVLITGSVTELSDTVRLTVKAMTTKTAAIQAAASVSLPKSATTMALLRRDVSGSAASPGSSNSAPKSSGVPNARAFQNDFLIAVVESISVKRERNTLNAFVSISLENKSGTDEFIAGKSDMFGDPIISLMDSLGRNWRRWSIGGLTGLSRTSAGEQPNAQRYTRLAAGSKQTVILKFSVRDDDDGPIPAADASFTMEMLRWRGPEDRKGSGQGFSVGVSNIPMTAIATPTSKPAGRK